MKLIVSALAIGLLGLRAEGFPQFIQSTSDAPDTKACLVCHGNHPAGRAGAAPLLPDYFQMQWTMYEVQSETSPPFENLAAAKAVLPGKTYYDWPARKMLEIYQDRCINIFPSGNEFSCKFISRDEKTYLIKYPIGDFSKPKSCCRWSADGFWAPRPDVLMNFVLQKQSSHQGALTDWWVYDIPLPGPFGYGTRTGIPETFWFPVIGVWAQQEFRNFSDQRPDPRVFDLPEECTGKVGICD